jgi:hypothetical protein
MDLPRPEGFNVKRALWVPQDIDSALSGNAQILGFADPRFMSCRQRYIGGLLVSGSMAGDPGKKHPDFERLIGVNEVWVMCFRAPHDNQWRLMGRFVQPNEFLGLALFSRKYLNGKRNYHAQAKNFENNWPTSRSFFVGSKIEDYISQPVRDPYVPRL